MKMNMFLWAVMFYILRSINASWWIYAFLIIGVLFRDDLENAKSNIDFKLIDFKLRTFFKRRNKSL